MKKMLSVLLATILLLSSTSVIGANRNVKTEDELMDLYLSSDIAQENIIDEVELKVYQVDTLEKGYIDIIKIEDNIEIDNNRLTIKSGNGSFSITEEINDENNFMKRTYNNSGMEIVQPQKNEAVIKNNINISNDNINEINIPYIVNMPEDGFMDFSIDKDGNKLDAVVVYDSNKNPIGRIFDLEVKDENDNLLDSDLFIEDNKLIQSINIKDESNFINSTMRATSLDYWHFYKSSKWITRGTGRYALALSVDTNPRAQWDSFASVAWKVLADRHRNDGNYLQGIFRPYFQGNEDGLYNQWLCHYMTVGHLKTWNLEPGRPNPGLTKTIRELCNPEW